MAILMGFQAEITRIDEFAPYCPIDGAFASGLAVRFIGSNAFTHCPKPPLCLRELIPPNSFFEAAANDPPPVNGR